MQKDGEFVSGPEYIVVTTSQSLNTGGLRKIVVNSEADLPRVDKIGVIGGGELNGRLADLGLIDEVILDVEQVELRDGIKLFGNHEPLNMKLVSEKTLKNATTVQKHYRVIVTASNYVSAKTGC